MAQIIYQNLDDAGTTPVGQQYFGDSFNWTNTNGVKASKGTLNIPFQGVIEFAEMGQITLIQEFAEAGTTQIVIGPLYILDADPETNADGDRYYDVKFADKRIQWERYGFVRLFNNVVDKDGKNVRGSEKATWKELVAQCVASLRETASWSNAATVPENPITVQNVIAPTIPPIKVLNALLDAAGFTLALQNDGTFTINQIGSGSAPTVADAYVRPLRIGEHLSEQPDKIIVVGGRYIIDAEEVELEACAHDLDGEIKGLDNVGWLSGLDVGEVLGKNYRNITNEKAKEIAKQDLGRLWRIPKTGLYADEIGGPVTLNRLNQDLPIHKSRGEKLKNGKFAPPEISGIWWEKEKKDEDDANKSAKRFRNVGTPDAGEKITSGWSVKDKDRGLIKTSKIIGHLENPEIDQWPTKKGEKVVPVELGKPKLKYAFLSLPHERWEAVYRNDNGTANDSESGAISGTDKVATIAQPTWLIAGDGKEFDTETDKKYKAEGKTLAQGLLNSTIAKTTAPGMAAGIHLITLNGATLAYSYTANPTDSITKWHVNLGRRLDGDFSSKEKSQKIGQLSGNAFSSGGLSSAFEFASGSGIVDDDSPIGVDVSEPKEELRQNNVNEIGPTPIRESNDEHQAALDVGIEGHDDHDLFGEIISRTDDGIPEYAKIAPVERQNFVYKDMSPDFISTDSESRSFGQLVAWLVQCVIDDKHIRTSNINRSMPMLRYSDFKGGASWQLWRIRQVPPGSYDLAAFLRDFEAGGFSTVAIPKGGFSSLNWLGGTEHTDKLSAGGWLCNKIAAKDQPNIDLLGEVKTPTTNLGQWTDVFDIPDDDILAFTPDDLDNLSLLNIKTRAHFYHHLEGGPDQDGSIAFEVSDPGTDGLGVRLYGRMRPAVELANSWGWGPQWPTEECKWVPSIGLTGVVWLPDTPEGDGVPGNWGFGNAIGVPGFRFSDTTSTDFFDLTARDVVPVTNDAGEQRYMILYEGVPVAPS